MHFCGGFEATTTNTVGQSGSGAGVARGDGGCTTPGEGELPAQARASEIEV